MKPNKTVVSLCKSCNCITKNVKRYYFDFDKSHIAERDGLYCGKCGGQK